MTIMRGDYSWLRFGVPPVPRHVKYLSLAMTGLPLGLMALIGGLIVGVTGAVVSGAVFVAVALCSLAVGTRMGRRDKASSMRLDGGSQHVHPQRRRQ
jgi:hypothetical protein